MSEPLPEIPLGGDFNDTIDLADFHPEEIGPEPERVLLPRERVPFVPLGVQAEVSPDTFRRKWKPKRQPWEPPEVPAPLVPAVYLGEDDEELIPPNARKLARAGHAAGWLTLVSFAIGPVIDAQGRPAHDDIMTEDEGFTPTGKPKTKKVGETVRPQQPTVLVRVVRDVGAVDRREPDCLFAGQWLGGDYGQPGTGKWSGAGWDHGVVLYPHRLVDWTTLWATFQQACEG
jgi:hypothetical protein